MPHETNAVMGQSIYVAGTMTGLPHFNYRAFNSAAEQLRAAGWQVKNPAESQPPACGTWAGWMRLALRLLTRCDFIYLLPGWKASRGARLEFHVACMLGLSVMYAPGAEVAQ